MIIMISQEKNLGQENIQDVITVANLGTCKKDCGKFKIEQKGKGEESIEENKSTTITTEGDNVFIVCDDDYGILACQKST